MSKTLYLRHTVVNQLIDSIEKNYLTSPLPSQAIIADMLSVSRTTIKHALDHLEQRGVLAKSANQYQIIRPPVNDDRFNNIPIENTEDESRCEKYFFSLIYQNKLLPNDIIDELDIARQSRTNINVVRKFLTRYQHYGLLKNVKRGIWQMIILDYRYASKIFELREMLEYRSLSQLFDYNDKDIIWVKAKDLLRRHKDLQANIQQHYREFTLLDHDFHLFILSAMDNPFFIQCFDLISIIFHYHYQWDDSDLKQRNSIAISEHVMVLQAIINKDKNTAVKTLLQHLKTAKSTMKDAINRSCENKFSPAKK